MMNRYAVLREKKDKCIRAAINAENSDFKKLWIRKAEQIQEKIDSLTPEQAMEVVR